MGHDSSIALGVAMQRPRRQVGIKCTVYARGRLSVSVGACVRLRARFSLRFRLHVRLRDSVRPSMRRIFHRTPCLSSHLVSGFFFTRRVRVFLRTSCPCLSSHVVTVSFFARRAGAESFFPHLLRTAFVCVVNVCVR